MERFSSSSLGYFFLAKFWNTATCRPPGFIASLIVTGKNVPHIQRAKNRLPVGYGLAILHSLFDWILLAVLIIVVIQLKNLGRIRHAALFLSQSAHSPVLALLYGRMMHPTHRKILRVRLSDPSFKINQSS